jgi:3-methyladenine DNA glycosylase AlkD
VQWFFKEEVRSHGWYTADLRRYARALHKELAPNQPVLLDVAERLFAGPVLEEKALAVTMLEPSLKRFGAAEFVRFERWFGKVSSWADHDALAMFLIGPMLVADPARAKRPLRWAGSPSRWRRRAAAVSLISGVRRGLFYGEARAVTERLVDDRDDMVQKGLGWLLREWAKHDPRAALPVLMEIRTRASRLVLRTACEKLSPAQRQLVLARS